MPFCPASNGSVQSCKDNCACVYAGNQSMITACNGQCVTSGGAPSVGVNSQGVQDTINSAIGGIFSGIVPYIFPTLERIGLFIFALILVVVGIVVVSQPS